MSGVPLVRDTGESGHSMEATLRVRGVSHEGRTIQKEPASVLDDFRVLEEDRPEGRIQSSHRSPDGPHGQELHLLANPSTDSGTDGDRSLQAGEDAEEAPLDG